MEWNPSLSRFTLCQENDFDKDSSYLLLFTSRRQDYSLYYSEDWALPKSRVPIEQGLADLLYSAISYPPAMALARRSIFNSDFNSSIHFLDEIRSLVECHLERQPEDRFCLARGKAQTGSEFTVNHFYWVVKVSGIVAEWVSEDYLLAECSVECFQDPQFLKAHFRGR